MKWLAALVVVMMATVAQARAEPPAFQPSAADLADLIRAEDYLNRIGTMTSRFLQASSGGSYAEGTLTLSRPGKMRLEYDPPVQMLIVADGTWLIYKDIELDEVSYLPLGSTPASIIVREKISFRGDDPKVTGIERAPGVLSITMTGEQADEGSMTLVFSDKPLELRKWIVIDPQGVKTSVSLLSSRYDIAVDAKLFFVKQPAAVDPEDR